MRYELEIEDSLSGPGVKTYIMDDNRVAAILHSQKASGDGDSLRLWDGIELKASLFLN